MKRYTAYMFSAKEREVVKHLARGISNEDIAREMNICLGTVLCHLNMIKARLAAITGKKRWTRDQMIEHVVENGIILQEEAA